MPEKESTLSWRSFWALCAFIGVLVFGASFAYVSHVCLTEAETGILKVASYVREQCAIYDNINLSAESRSLMRVGKSAQYIAEELRHDAHAFGETPEDEDYLKRLLIENYLTGVYVLDTNGTILAQQNTRPETCSQLQSLFVRPALLSTAYAARKVYTVRLTCDDGSYIDAAAYGRLDAGGVIVACYHTSAAYAAQYNLNCQSIVQSYSLKYDGIVAAAKNDVVVASNDTSLVGRDVDDLPALAGFKDPDRQGKMTGIKEKDGIHHRYGTVEEGRNFCVYVSRSEGDIFAQAPSEMMFGLLIYGLMVLLFWNLRRSTDERYRTAQYQREKNYQDNLRAEAERAEAANRAKTEFLQRMSHDIRTPINGIRGMVEIAEKSSDPDKKAECLGKIWDASTLLLELVNEVLDMGKLESGEIVLEEVPFDLTELMQELDSVVAKTTAEHAVRLEMVPLPQGLPTALVGSPLHLKRLLMNLLSNGVKYNKENGVVTLDCTEVRREGSKVWLQFRCADTGIGMSEEFQKKIYEPFTQEHSGARSKFSGTGLGMAITKSLVEKMDGEIELDSKLGIGTTFTVTLPFQIDRNAQKTSTGAPQPADPDRLKGKHILLVEDNDLNREIAEFLLEGAGIVVTKAENGQQALDLFKDSEPGGFDAILMDVMMPVMGGYAATRAIRALDRPDAKTVPIIALTANAFVEDRQKALYAGMNEHLTKPLDAEAMFKVLAKYCGNK